MQTLFERVTLFRSDPADLKLYANHSVLVEDGKIAWYGPEESVPRDRLKNCEHLNMHGRLMTPGLVECHTHLVWGGSREEEFVERCKGSSYEEILARGGGIHSTVRATKAMDPGKLFEAAIPRLERFRRQGVTTIEIKSGYGLDYESEIKILEVIQDLDSKSLVEVVPTLLAHTIPAEYKDRRAEYVELITSKLVPGAEGRGLASAVDVFCDKGAFTVEETRKIFDCAKHHGFNLRVHAEQLSLTGAAKLAGEMGAHSADHLEHLDDAGIAAMKNGETVAVVLPGAIVTLGSPKPPVAKLRAAGVPVALSTDCNPGSSHTTNLHLMMSLGCVLFGMSPEEAMLGVTTYSAQALGLSHRIGRIEEGFDADFVVWNCKTVAAIPYHMGENLALHSYKQGRQLL